MDSSKLKATQTALLKLGGSQNKRQGFEKRICRESGA